MFIKAGAEVKAFAFGQWLRNWVKDSSWRVSGISLGVERKSLGTEQQSYGQNRICRKFTRGVKRVFVNTNFARDILVPS